MFCNATTDARSLTAIEYMERFADGEGAASELTAAQGEAHKALREIDSRPPPEGIKRTDIPELSAAQAAFHLVNKDAIWCAHATFKTSAAISDTLRPHLGDDARAPKWAEQLRTMCQLIRDIFGNPFRPVAFHKTWRTSTAVALARQMYESRDFCEMPILADALQEAGCDNEDILAHCRDANQPHARGCWVVDLVLGKE
jgi:hypothetical protein